TARFRPRFSQLEPAVSGRPAGGTGALAAGQARLWRLAASAIAVARSAGRLAAALSPGRRGGRGTGAVVPAVWRALADLGRRYLDRRPGGAGLFSRRPAGGNRRTGQPGAYRREQPGLARRPPGAPRRP